MEALADNLELPAGSVTWIPWIRKFSALVGSGTGFRHLGYFADEVAARKVAEDAFKRLTK